MSETTGSSGVRRREFLKVLGAAGATAATVGCATDKVEQLIPYLVQPDETVPGVSNYYASTCRECSAGCGLLLETRDGRTFKLEGNPVHPLNRGALCAIGQAGVQGLYNPDRVKGPMVRGAGGKFEATSWDKALALLTQKLGELQASGRAGSALFINRHESGSFGALLDAWLAAHGMPAHLSYDPLANGAVIAANKQSYGVAWPWHDFGAARLIVSFGADFLEHWGANVPQQLEFADARAKLKDAPRFVYIGPRRSLTGLNADQWIACRPGGALSIANALAGNGSLDQAATDSGVPAALLHALSAELESSKPSLVLAGGRGAHAMDLALAVNAINQRAGNVGTTVVPGRAITSLEGGATDADVMAAVDAMRAGQVGLLMVRGANIAYTLPTSAKAGDAMAKVPFKVSFSSYLDETASLCDLILPDNHPIESWGDAQPLAGVLSMQQPGMDPVYDTRQTADVLIAVARQTPKIAASFAAPNYRQWLISRYPGGVAAFTAAVQKGIGSGTAAVTSARRAPRPAPPAAAPAPQSSSGPDELQLVVYHSPALADGSGANKPWLQELPDPVTKVCWQSCVEIHPSTAKRLEIDAGDIVTLQTASGSVSAPAYLYLGVRPDTVALALGRGHTAYGRYAKGIGVNAGDLVPVAYDAKSGALAWTGQSVRLTKTGKYAPLVTTEGSARQFGRDIARAIPVAEVGAPKREHEKIPGDASHEFLPGLRAPVAQDAQGVVTSDNNEKGMYAPTYWAGMTKRRWAMTVDLARCTGCSACVTACQAENNVPTVGAPYQSTRTAGLEGQPGANILRGREMAWIRLERYWEGGEDGGDFEARFIPMMCQHCGNAPCEPVCPVYATYSSPDGLNVQVYNRCVGTRYCSNNCPYKVRYFNWFGYGETNREQYAWPERMNWQLNPDVTVRSKGVMEKCSFCVQRIREMEHRVRLEGRPLVAEEFTTSCAQACPSRAITFGDAADENWSVAHMVNDPRAYHVFEEINTFTAVVYLKKVNHPAPGAPAKA